MLIKKFLVYTVFKAITLSLPVEILSDGRKGHIFKFIQSLKESICLRLRIKPF